MQVNFHKYKSAALWSRLLSRKQITHSHLLSGLMEQELNTLGFQPFSDSQGPDSSQEYLLSTSQGHTEVFPWCQPGPGLWPRWRPALQTAGSVLAFRELWQGKGAGQHQAHQCKSNLTTSFEQPDIDWAHSDLESQGKAFFACQHSELYLWIPTAG